MTQLHHAQTRVLYSLLTWRHQGYSSGSKGLWCKRSNFENGVRIPMMIYVPPALRNDALHDVIVDDIAESVDLFPTLADLAGLQLPSFVRVKHLSLSKLSLCLFVTFSLYSLCMHFFFPTFLCSSINLLQQRFTGKSLVPILTGGHADASSNYAVSQWPRRLSCISNQKCEDGTGNPFDLKPDQCIMSYSMRTPQWRYVAWFNYSYQVGCIMLRVCLLTSAYCLSDHVTDF